MIDLYYWPTPNGWKISIALEELELPYKVVPVNIGRGEQFKPEFLAISPNNRMPAIVDHSPVDGGGPLSIFESGAILLYLADKTGRLCPKDLRGRTEVVEWLMWQMGGLGPMSGQANHFRNYAPEKLQYGIDRYTNETNRLYGVLDKRLAGREFICGGFSIADCASWPWLLSHDRIGQNLAEFPNLNRWYDALKERPSVRRGIDVGKELRVPGTMDEKAKQVLFGQTAKSVTR
ncbi:MAG TPA: glutathione S-transferase N-terminal domain-containing protein [Myxococcota bacterium]|nr:glutathione S-transferase N-terminal domain-containing protein [Myxococcota bacterium]